MKQYTIYQAIKYSEGKLTRNKLEKAINRGEIAVQSGTGKAKYLIDENELLTYLEVHVDALKNPLMSPKEDKENTKEIANNDYIERLLSEKETVIQLKDEKIKYLEANYQRYLPKLDEEGVKETERKTLLIELTGLSIFKCKRKREILSRLMALS